MVNNLALIRDPASIAELSRNIPASKRDRLLFEGGLYSRQYGILILAYSCALIIEIHTVIFDDFSGSALRNLKYACTSHITVLYRHVLT